MMPLGATLAILLYVSIQHTGVLDLTAPMPPRSSKPSVVVETKELPLTVRLLGLVDQGYTIGTSLNYEIELTNDSVGTVVVPWTGDPTLFPASEPADLSASLSLSISNDGVTWHYLTTGVYMLGNANAPMTVNSLAPGVTARIRASGEWVAPTLNIRNFLAASSGRVYVRAVYRKRSGTTLASTEPSSPVSVTLSAP